MLRLLLCFALAISFSANAQDKFTLQLNWFHLADHSPIYMALKKGYYKEEGIDLTVSQVGFIIRDAGLTSTIRAA